ncbi:glycosyltransferase family 9 protein [Caldimonas tepidiphila]|uniref:glycosyltransferase family 9 protein n=1 Tax=Caldimonas tepidiphila TaxID=2315841 RepID=UPI000E5AC78C|nr:glycosyltransferase family 9 protein [Caldimonas tepidiphila]
MSLAPPCSAAEGLYAGRGERIDGVQRIAVLRASAVGDFLLALPALEALRRAYPDARISLIGRAWHAAFLAGRPGPVDEVIVMPPLPGVSLPERAPQDDAARSAVDAWLSEMRSRRFDLALQMHGGGRHSNPLVRALGARVSAGLQAPGSPPLDRVLPYRELHPEALRLLELVALVGAPGTRLEPRVAVTEADRAEAAAVLPPSPQPLVLLQPGATDPRRRWSPAHFAEVGAHFARLGAQVAVNGTADEAAQVAAVLAALPAGAQARELTGRLSLGGLAGLIERSRLVVSNDTGPAHLARALGVPSVAVYWVGNMIGYGPLSCARQAAAVSWRLDCPACGRNSVGFDCGHTDSFVDDVSVQQVIALAQPLFDGA